MSEIIEEKLDDKQELKLSDQKKIIDISNEELDSLWDSNNSDKDKKYSQMKTLIQRWVTSVSLLAKTIWVDRWTIYNRKESLNKEYEILARWLWKHSEMWKMLEQLDMMIYWIWKEINTWNMTEKDKVYAIVQSLAPLKMKAEIFWFLKWKDPFVWIDKTQNLTQINTNIYNYYTQLLWWDKEKVKWMLSIEEITWIKPI